MHNCTGLTSIVIPESVTEIGDYAFDFCSGLKTVSILGPVKTMTETFRYCSSLEIVTLGVGIKKMDDVFKGCTSLKTINVPSKKGDYYKKRLPSKLHSLIVELPAVKKAKK